MLLTLLLLAAVLAFTLTMILPDTIFELKRDREQELVHRGVQYTRAIQAYYKKFGRYPTRLEELESTNNLRFLRRRYKDPENKNQDFKLLHFGEVKLAFTGGIAGATIPGATMAGAPGGLNSQAAGAVLGALAATSQQNSLAGGSGSSFGSSSSFSSTSNQPGTSSSTGTDSSQSPSQPSGSSQSGSGISSDQLPGQVFGGGSIVGVASTSKAPSIREYNHKRKYDEWQFVYDPAGDRGGLITTPYQPSVATSFLNQTGQPGQSGTSTSSPFSSSPFGTNPGSNANPNPSSPGTPPPQPGNPPQQQ
ncbi:MAG: hypothetical protein WCA16_20965 [Candidatus Sulfotelmatobacter sp.]